MHRSAWNRNSRKFKVASNRSDAALSTRQQHGGTPSASKRPDLVAGVAPLCIKELRLVTTQLPENSANFAFWGFSEVRGSQASMALCSSEKSVGPTSKRDPRKEAPNAHHHRPVNSRCSNASCGRWAGFGAATILHRAAQATQRRCRLYLRRLGCRLRRAFRAHAYRRLGTMERGRGPYY